jgi:hypothetical protein
LCAMWWNLVGGVLLWVMKLWICVVVVLWCGLVLQSKICFWDRLSVRVVERFVGFFLVMMML